MKNLSVLFLTLIIFSCTEKDNNEIYQGKLEELLLEDFSLEKDSTTRYFNNIRVVGGSNGEHIVYTKAASKFEGLAIVFVSPITGKEVDRIEIPTEGPESMKGGNFVNIIPSKDLVILMNQIGEIGEYNAEAKQIALHKSYSDFRGNAKFLNVVSILPILKIIQFENHTLQLGNNPSKTIKTKKPVAAGEMRSEFPLDFKEWITHINLETGEIITSNFSMPEGYEGFKNDLTSTLLFGIYDSKRELYYLAWPYSDDVYVLDGVNLERVIKPFSSVELKYLPSEREPIGEMFTNWTQPKNASKQLFLLYDEQRDLIIRCSKIEESGASESTFERTKHYVLSIYSGEWEPKGEYFFDFETEIEVENWFLTSEGLFINKPEQKSEDAYQFYTIDLSRFGK